MPADHRPDAYWEGDTLILRASSLGGCVGALVRTGIGMSPSPAPESMQERWAQGVVAEPLIIAEVERQGWVVSYAGEDEQLELEVKVGNKIKIRCHPDGLATRLDGDGFPVETLVLEAKCLRPSFDREFLPYKWQSSVEQAATGFALLWAYGEKGEDGKLADSDSTDQANWLTDGTLRPKVELKRQDTAPYSLVDIKKRALQIYRAIVESEIPACDQKQYPCGFWREDDTLCAWKPEAKVEAEDLGLPESVVQEFLVAKRVKEDAEKDLAEVQGRIKGILKDRPGAKYQSHGLTFTKRKGSSKFDRKAAEKAGLDLSPYVKPGVEHWAITESEST